MKWVLIILLLALIFLFSVHTLTSINRDIGRHLTTGEIIWKTHQVPKTNFFSFTNPNFPVVNHHWLAQVFFYLINGLIGLKGLILFKASIITASFSLVLFAYFKKENILVGAALLLISIFIFVERTDVRPEIFSFLFLSWYIFVLFRRPGKLIWSLPAVQLLWVNTHIYFFLGPLLFLLFFIDKIIKKELTDVRHSQIFLIGVLLAAVDFLNPFFWKGALYPLLIFKNYALPVVENMSPLINKSFMELPLSGTFLLIGVLISVIGIIVNYKNLKKNLFYTTVLIVGATLSFLMIRNLPVFALVFLPITWKNFHESGFVFKAKWLVALGLVFLGLLIHAVISNQFYSKETSSRKFGLNIPTWGQAAIDFVRDNKIQGPIFNNFRIGSFLIWKLPEEKVFIDTRPEAYPASFISDIYVPMQVEPDRWELYNEHYHINLIFFSYHDASSWAKKFLEHISKNPKWSVIYKDGSIIIFIKNIPQNKEIVERFSNV